MMGKIIPLLGCRVLENARVRPGVHRVLLD